MGAIIAGGGSLRFGSDKAAALLDGHTLIEHVLTALASQTDTVGVCGREWPGMVSIADRPGPGLGPLGGLCGVLHYAAANGFDAVLTAGCDVLPVPDLRMLASESPAVIDQQWLFGCWPVTLRDQLDDHLIETADRSLRQWIAQTGARRVLHAGRFHNINTPVDLARYRALTEDRSSRR